MNRELIAIANEAIPLDPKCRIKTNQAIIKRVWLIEKIEAYVKKQLENQFNAKEVYER